MATGKPRTADTFIKNVTMPLEEILKSAKKKIAKLKTVPLNSKPIKLNAQIVMKHGKEIIADNKKGFEAMEIKYRNWLKGLTE